jgi:hypothetical protein
MICCDIPGCACKHASRYEIALKSPTDSVPSVGEERDLCDHHALILADLLRSWSSVVGLIRAADTTNSDDNAGEPPP